MLRISFALAVAVALAPAACHHDAGSAPPSNRLAPVSEAVTATDPLGFLPIDDDVVLGIDLRSLRASALWAEYLPRLRQTIASELADIQRTCGFDPLQVVDSVTLGIHSRDTSDSVLVLRGPDRDRTLACLRSNLIPGTVVTEDRGVLLLAGKTGAQSMVAFADRSTLVLQSAKHPSADALRATLRSGSPLRGSPGFLGTFQRLEPGAMLWLVVNGTAPIFDKFDNAVGRPVAVFGTLRVTDGFSAQLHVRMAAPDAATQLAGLIRGQIHQAGTMFDRLEVSADGEVATLVAEMSRDKVRALVAMLGNLVGSAATSP